MKKILSFILICLSISTNGQVKPLQKESNGSPDSTAFGVADGNVSRKEIGASGGTIISDDGKVELIFPAGALAGTTNVSIQPTTNPLSYGAGKAYQFEPSGTQFNKPVEVIFHYTEEEAEVCPPELMGFSMQDDNGRWSSFEYDDWDSTTKTLKGFIHHFSHFTDVKKLMLRSARKEIRVGDTTFIEVMDKGVRVDTGSYKGDYEIARLHESLPSGWYINGIPKGDDKVGTMETISFLIGKDVRAEVGKYHAPRYLPKTSFVDVKLAVAYYSKKSKKKLWGYAACSILLYDAYKVQVIDDYSGRPAMQSEIIDSGSFSIIVYQSQTVYRIMDIKNYDPILSSEGRNGPFREKVFTKDAQGSVQIPPTIKSYEVTGDDPPKVNLTFPVSTILKYKFQYVARGTKSPVTPLYNESIPEEIHFVANSQEQHYEQGDKYKYQVIIKPCLKCVPPEK